MFVLMAGRQAGGPETYEIELIRALSHVDKQNEYIIYCTSAECARAIGVEQQNFTFRILRPASRLMSVPFTLPALMMKDGVDFFHSTFTPPPFFPGKSLVFTMHGMVNFFHPEFYARPVLWRLNPLMQIGMYCSERVLCVSRQVWNQAHEMFKIPEDRLHLSYHGVSPAFRLQDPCQARERVREKYGIDRPYFLFAGKIQRCKNIERLIQAFALFRQEQKVDMQLVLAGRNTSPNIEVEQLVAQQGLNGHVVRTGYLSHDELPELYSGAAALTFPSLFESFGMPIIEAMASGIPVLTSPVASIPEVAGGAALMVDPYSVEAIAEGMGELVRDSPERARLVKDGLSRAKEFTWERCALSTLEAYNQMR